jgi:serine/threonine protein kinase
MDAQDRLAALLLRWQEAFEKGQDLTVPDLCRDCPELADELRHYIDFQKRMHQLTVQTATPAPANATPSEFQDLATPPCRPDPVTQGTLHPVLAELLGRKSVGETDLLGRYRILRLLGQGGMGAVFLAEDTVAHRQVALKFMKPDAGGSRERFLREARAAAQLEDDHVVRIYHVDEIDGVPYFVMPYLKGESLEARLHRAEGKPLPPAEVVQIGREAALGLAAAHARGLIHRDIKPGNLWLERKESTTGFRTLVLDFGLARPPEGGQLTRPGAILGTPGYMSPEQADGLPLDGRADLFSLGCVLYRLATGRPAFDGKTTTALLRAVAEQEPRPVPELNPIIPQELAALILRLLAKDPAKRPVSARDAIKALQGMDQTAPPSQPTTVDVAPKGITPSVKSEKSTTRGIKINVSVGWGYGRYIGCAASLMLMVALLVTPGLVWMQKRSSDPDGELLKSGASVTSLVQKGSVDIRIWRGPDGEAQKLRLGEPGALPLYAGDKFRIEAHVEVPAYLYLFWINTEGQALPLYPWKPGKWGTRPAEENPARDVSLPVNRTAGYEIKKDVEGMETLLMLARATPLPLDDAALQKLFAGIGQQRPIQDRRSAVWFENGKVVEGDPHRKRDYFDTEVGLNDPVLRLQSLIEERLQPQASFTSAVSFARLGERK